MYWAIGVYGQGFKVIRPLKDREFMELRIEYSLGVRLMLEVPAEGELSVSPPLPNSMVSIWEPSEPSAGYSGGTLVLEGNLYDVSLMNPLPQEQGEGEGAGYPWAFIAMIILIALVATGGYLFFKKRKGKIS